MSCDGAKWVQGCTDESVDGGQGFSVLLSDDRMRLSLRSLAPQLLLFYLFDPTLGRFLPSLSATLSRASGAFIRPARDNTAVASPN